MKVGKLAGMCIGGVVVWNPLSLDPSDGVFGRFDLAALCGCRTFNFCLLFVCYIQGNAPKGEGQGQR